MGSLDSTQLDIKLSNLFCSFITICLLLATSYLNLVTSFPMFGSLLDPDKCINPLYCNPAAEHLWSSGSVLDVILTPEIIVVIDGNSITSIL